MMRSSKSLNGYKKLLISLCIILSTGCNAGNTQDSSDTSTSNTQTTNDMLSQPIYTSTTKTTQNDPQSAESIGIQQISPANGDTGIGISAPVIVTFKTKFDLTGISASLIDANNANSAEIPLIMNGNDLTYTFTPNIKLKPNTTYKFVLNRKGSNTSSKVLTTSSYTTQASYKIFLTSGDYKGNLRGSYSNASTGADAICNSDAGSPDKTQYYKAMFSVVGERYACASDSVCGGTNSLNWVLQPGTGYYNVNSELIGTTTGQSIFIFPLTVAFGVGSSNHVWTGLSTTWGSVDGGDSCKAWTSSSSENKGRCGRSGQIDPGAISNDKQDCNGHRKLYCVMQPNAVLTNPLARSTTNNYTTPISVMFNVVSGVNPATVTTSTFTVSESSPETTGHLISGTIATTDNINFTFSPSSSLVPGKTYTVHLSSSIMSNSGTPISATNISFYTATETKLLYLTSDKWWGDLLKTAQKAGSTATTGVAGADYLCQIDAQCPAGKTCKAVISDDLNRIACVDNPNDPESAVKLCGAGHSVDWVLTPNTTYVNTKGTVIGTTNSQGIFNFLLGFQFSEAISDGGKAWTGLMPFWTSKKNITCERWTIGDSGVNQLAGMIGYSEQINHRSICAGAGHAGGCSQYNKEDGFGGKYCYTEVDGKKVLDGCSKRGLYCAVQ
ncbi:MAG: DUF1554 domain-containing protein [Neisseriales bacterium]|nr:MAG: DUF1554 domain-containing protein [Neisseriales bacterium]